MKDFRETCFTRIEGDAYMFVSSGERKWINRIKKDAEKYPDDVKILAVNKDGSLYARYPFDWAQYPRPKRKRPPMTEEQRSAARERLARAREIRDSN